MLFRLKLATALSVVGAGVLLGIVPHIFGLLLGFLAFLITPIVWPLALIVGGMFVYGIAEDNRRFGVALIVNATVIGFCLPFIGLEIQQGRFADFVENISYTNIAFAFAMPGAFALIFVLAGVLLAKMLTEKS